MRGQLTLYVDQWGNKFFARTVRELWKQIPGRCYRMNVDGMDGRTYHIGYIIGQHWLEAYQPVRIPV